MPRPTAAERLARTKARTAEAKAKLDAKLRADESAAREEARRLHQKHLWALARLCDETGLGALSVEVLRPHLNALAQHLQAMTRDQANASGHGMADRGSCQPGDVLSEATVH